MLRWASIICVLALSLGAQGTAAAAHPQDGPHADLRIAIEDHIVRFSVGVNLAFLDEVIDVPREALGELSPDEADRVLQAFRAMLTDRAPCLINGEPATPVFERLEIFTNPDPGMIAIFEKMGTRALIRATAVMRYDADDPIDTVELTWPAYPFDQLAEEMEGTAGGRPRMYFEAVLTAGGKSSAARFTNAEPTMRWSREDIDAPDPLLSLPSPASPEKPTTSRFLAISIFAACAALGAAGIVRTKRAWTRGAFVASLALAIGLSLHLRVVTLPRGAASPLVTDAQAAQVLLTLHESMYRAFDYTSESDIYDRLALALEGDLLGELYEQIRLSLLQAEQEMKVGIVTGLKPIETTITAIDDAGTSATDPGFDATHRWRVDGTVYHWGHSHSRAHIYEANYRVSFTQAGWRITDHTLLSQLRIDPEDGEAFEPSDPLQQALDQLGSQEF